MHPIIVDIPAETTSDTTMITSATLRFLGANREENPTKFVVSLYLAEGFNLASEPSINADDPSKVDLNVHGEAREGSGITSYLVVDVDGGDSWQFEVSLNVDGSRVTYIFKKKRTR